MEIKRGFTIIVVILLVGCSHNKVSVEDVTNPFDKNKAEYVRAGIPETAELQDEDDKVAIYLNVDSVWRHDINITSIWMLEKQTSRARVIFRDSVYSMFSARIIPYTDPSKVIVEGTPEYHNIWSFIVDSESGEVISLPNTGGLVGFGNDEGVIIMQSYQYYQAGGRYSKIDAYDQYGNKIASMKTNLKPDK